MKQVTILLLSIVITCMANPQKLHLRYRFLYKALNIQGSARIGDDATYWSVPVGDLRLTRDNSGIKIYIENIAEGFTIEYNTNARDSLEATLITPEWQKSNSQEAYEKYCKAKGKKGSDIRLFTLHAQTHLDVVTEIVRQQVKKRILVECQKGKPALIEKALERVASVSRGNSTADDIRANLDKFDIVKVEYSDDDIRVTIDQRCMFIPLNSKHLYGITVSLFQGTISYNIRKNWSDIQKETWYKKSSSPFSKPKLFTHTGETNKIVAKIFPDGVPAEEVLIYEKESSYNVEVTTVSTRGWFSVDKKSWKRYDKRHKHFASSNQRLATYPSEKKSLKKSVKFHWKELE